MKKMIAIGMALIAWTGVAGTVTVEGKGCVTRYPDGMKLKFSLETVDKDMAKSRMALAEKRAKIRTAMAAAGVVDEEVTDSNIRMNPEYHNEDAEGNVLSEYTEKGKRVFGGYKHSMTFDFKAKLNLERLEKVYLSLVKTRCVEDLSVDFYLTDPKPVQDEARRLAVTNARTVADELCKAASATLGEVKEINYNARNYGADICCSEAKLDKVLCGEDDTPLFPGINVEDIEISDEVLVKWEIK